MRKRIVGIVFIVIIGIIISCNFSGEEKLTTKKISYNGDNLRISIDGETASTLPTSGTYYLADYNCQDSNTRISWDKDNYKLNVTNNTSKGGLACYLDFQSHPLLSSMEVGSYVAYVGNNGCEGNSCNGQNANYVSNDNMGYCYGSNYKFIANGWRVGYIKNSSVHLISAGAVDCICTDEDGKMFNTKTCATKISSTHLDQHVDNLNSVSLKYCNSSYTKDGRCDSTTVWAMNDNDFKMITGSVLSSSSCNAKNSDKSCGYNNDLIDNGSMYWVNAKYSSTGNTIFAWSGSTRKIGNNTSENLRGVRPVINLEPNVIVLSGSGTYADPYIIGNNTFIIDDGSSYVKNKSSVGLKLIASSDVAKMCISEGSSGCSNYVDFANTYTMDWSSESDGEKIVYVYYKDSNGKIIASINKKILLDTKAPVRNSVAISEGNTVNRTLTLSSLDGKYMCISNLSSNANNCNDWVDYNTTYSWRLSDGSGLKTVYVFFKDEAGNVSSAASASVTLNKECLAVNGVYNIAYSGDKVTSNGLDVKLCAGTYKMQLWGAQGGNSGGKGGYSTGNVTLTGNETLYFYVGGAGGKGIAGYNGGGTTGNTGGGGGGATDIRVGEDSLLARFIVAGGGGGNGRDSCAVGAVGGGTSGGGAANQGSNCGTQAGGGTQTAGGAVGIYVKAATSSNPAETYYGLKAGEFGIGGDAEDSSYDGGAGGGGWYGGGAGTSAAFSNGGGGGSGFVYTSSSTLPDGYVVNSIYQLANASTVDGTKSTIPNISGTGTETGHAGNGYIKITRLS